MVSSRTAALTAAAILGLAGGSQAWAAPAAAPASPRQPYGPPITLEQAKAAIAAAEAAAHRMGSPYTLAVVEPSGDLVLVERSTGGSYGTVEAALSKARSAARFRIPTAAYDYTRAYPPGMAAGVGGIPIVLGGKIIGGIGQAGVAGDALIKAGAAAVR